ncbi:GrpB family protein [Paenibacillus arenilitoris]|uniref:GrpB family protein n=1 Tax=Paenibacillus arenilitoris TaxID=2772299 RepID=A0A927CKR1_9BACL|nr:GrpB family protein [Paenibacillus arenilitoris]MBD2867460.1 GrpB family protein [Paenibacillus arenilitoris]
MTEQEVQQIVVVPFDPDWSRQFERERGIVSEALGPALAAVEHTGSTAIPNQAAKPIIDMFAAVRPFAEASVYADKLSPAGYSYVETGMEGRYLFAKKRGGVRTGHLHILPLEGFYERNELLFRDYLRAHPDFVRQYGELKQRLAEQFPSDGEQYTRAKTAFIQQVVDLARQEKGLPWQNVWESQV